MPRLLPILLAFAQATAVAADTLPRHLAGTWGTAETLFDGTDEQLFVFLAGDGAAAVIGSRRAPAAATGDGGAPGRARPVMGFPATASLDGDMVTLRPFDPARPLAPGAEGFAIRCRHDAAAVTLTCTGPDGVRQVLRFRGDAIPPDAAQAIDIVRKHHPQT